jgi:very-short-patch-repair endonuclease
MHTSQLIVLGVAILVLLGLASLLPRLLKGGGSQTYPYVRIDALFSPAERSFFGILSQVVGDRYIIFGKIRLADIIKPESGLSQQQRYSALNRITSKHVDFALCDLRTLAIVGVIELDDKSHKADRGRDRDAFIDAALAAAGVPVLHVQTQKAYMPSEIGAKISAAFQATPNEPAITEI